jgi:hypothetical protein
LLDLGLNHFNQRLTLNIELFLSAVEMADFTCASPSTPVVEMAGFGCAVPSTPVVEMAGFDNLKISTNRSAIDSQFQRDASPRPSPIPRFFTMSDPEYHGLIVAGTRPSVFRRLTAEEKSRVATQPLYVAPSISSSP